MTKGASKKRHNKPMQTPGIDFGGFDRKLGADLWKVWVKSLPSNYVFVFAGTWIEARQVTQTIFHLEFDAFDGAIIKPEETVFLPGQIIAFCLRDGGKPTGVFKKFRALREISANFKIEELPTNSFTEL